MLFPILCVVPVVLLAAVTLTTVKILREYERAVVFTLERFLKVKGPGLVMLVPFVQEMVRVDLRIPVIEIPTQSGISRDNHTGGKFEASQTMVNAAKILGSIPAAMQLRHPQTLTEIGDEQNSAIVFSMPIDIVKPFLALFQKSGRVIGTNGDGRVQFTKDVLPAA